MLHSFKHAAPASVRRPSQDGYRPRNSQSRPSGDFRRAARQRQSLDVRPARHSSSDLYQPPQRRASEPLRQTPSDAFQLNTPPPSGSSRLGSPNGQGSPLELNGIPVYSLSPTASPAESGPTQVVDGNGSQPMQSSIAKQDIDERPPPLPYSLWDHKFTISFFWFLILAESCFVPIALYYGLIYGTNLREGALFAIITSVFGFITGYEYGCRGYLLLKKNDKYRPLNGSPRFWGFDSLQWLLSGPYAVMTGILIGGSIPHPPLQRVLATPIPVAFIMFGIMFVLNGIAVQRKWRLKYFRMSSYVKGAVTPPIIFSIIEDVVAVDGGGGQKYRTALITRYNASSKFRTLLMHMTWFWGVPCLLLGVVLMALIFTLRREVQYGLAWTIPSIWAGLWTLITIFWVKKVLREEERDWQGPTWLQPEERADGGAAPCADGAAVEMAQPSNGSVAGGNAV